MVQSDIPRGRTQSGKINVKWYLERLKTSATTNNTNLKRRNSNSTIRVVRGTTATQGKFIPKVYLTSTIQQKSFDYNNSNSLDIKSGTSLKSSSITNKISPSISELNSNSYQSIKTNHKDEKDNLSLRRSSSGTLISVKGDLISRPPSTPVDPRCQRDYLSTRNSIQRETCQLLGPQLCSDCIEIQTRSNLSPEYLPNNLIRQRLSSLAIRPFLPNQQNLTDDHLFQMINNQQIKILNNSTTTPTNQFNTSIISDQEYFQNLSSSLNQYSANNVPFYFKDLKDFQQKYQSNKYPRLYLSQTQSPISANPIFKQSSFEKFDVSAKYSYMKQSSTIKHQFKTNSTCFISPKKSQQFYNQNRFLINYSPPLLSQASQQHTKKYSNHSINNKKTLKPSLINSKSYRQTIDV